MPRAHPIVRIALLAWAGLAACTTPPDAPGEDVDVRELPGAVTLACAEGDVCTGSGDVLTSSYRIGSTPTSLGEFAQTFTATQTGRPASLRLLVRHLRTFTLPEGTPPPKLLVSIHEVAAPTSVVAVGPRVASGEWPLGVLPLVPIDVPLEASHDLEQGHAYAVIVTSEELPGNATGAMLVGIGAFATDTYGAQGHAFRRGLRRQTVEAEWGEVRWRPAGPYQLALSIFVPPSCENGALDQDETDVDCGGATCVARCANGDTCLVDPDCASARCWLGSCLAADAPALVSSSPLQGPPGTIVTITGTGFGAGAKAYFDFGTGPIAAGWTSVTNATTLRAAVPAATIGATAAITVRAASGAESNRLANAFLVTAPSPVTIPAGTLAGNDTTYDGRDVVISSTVTIAGEHAFSSVTITSTGTLTHAAGDTGGVRLVVGGLLDVQPGGKIDVSGRGGRGGRNGGNASDRGEWWSGTGLTTTGGAISRGGGSYGSNGGLGIGGSTNPPSGDPRAPQEVGAGGGFGLGNAGGNGGGRVDVFAGSVQLNGQILSNGTNCPAPYCGGGSGGAVRFVVTGAVSGTGSITTTGGTDNVGGSRGSGGRIAITGYTSGAFTGTTTASTVFFMRADSTGGVFVVNGSGASNTVNAGEGVDQLTITNGGALTLNTPLSFPSLSVGGSLTTNATLTIAGTLSLGSGTSTFNQPLTVGTLALGSGTATFQAPLVAPIWAQSNGTANLNAPLTNAQWSQTGGSATLAAGVVLAPGTFTLSNASFTNAGTTTIPSYTAATITSSTVVNYGTFLITDDTLVEIATNATLEQYGEFRGATRPSLTVNALRVASSGTLRQSQYSPQGLQFTVLGLLDLQAGSTVVVTGAGGRGGRNGANGSDRGEWWNAGTVTTTGGAISRAGGSYGASGQTGIGGSTNPVYDDFLAPTHPGAGGGFGLGNAGGNGGGLVSFSATDANLHGQIVTNGTNCGAPYCGGGSGGGIRVVLTGALTGTGTLTAVGGTDNIGANRGSGGRIAITGHTSGAFTGTANAATVFVRRADASEGVFVVNGNGAAATIGAGDGVQQITITGGGALTVNRPLSFTDFAVGGSLTMNAPLTVTGTLSLSTGASTFAQPVTTAILSMGSGAATFQDALVAPTWSQSGGTANLNGPLTNSQWSQTGGSATIGTGVTLAPSTFTLSNASFTNLGTTTIPAYTAATIASSTVVNSGTFLVTDDSLVEIGAYSTLEQYGEFRGTTRPSHTLGALRVLSNGTLRQSQYAPQGLVFTLLGQLDLQAGSTVLVTGAGGRGGRNNGSTSDRGEWWNAGTLTNVGGALGRGGGSYGASGQLGVGGSSNPVYGDPQAPIYPGAGGGFGLGNAGGNGGGLVWFTAVDANLNGQITSNGTNCGAPYCGGGSGGGIRVALTGALSGTGALTAVGGTDNIGANRGSGGRIAVSGQASGSFSGTTNAASVYLP